MKRLIGVIAALMFGVGMALAAGEPIEVTADTFTIDEDGREAVFSGNVVVKRVGLDMQAATVRILYGEGGQSDIRDVQAGGGVRIKAAGQDAVGDKASFDPATQILKLTGNVRVTNVQGTVKGPDLTINLANNTSVFSGGQSGGRVTGVFTPK